MVRGMPSLAITLGRIHGSALGPAAARTRPPASRNTGAGGAGRGGCHRPKVRAARGAGRTGPAGPGATGAWRGVPPLATFPDTTLRELVLRRPKPCGELNEVYGVGAKKAADFGDAFLDAIRTAGGRD